MEAGTGGPRRRALVTGAAGFIGSHLVTRLSDLGWHVVGIDNERSGDWSRLLVPCTRIERDLATMTTSELAAATAGVDVCFHLAAEKYNSSRTTPERIIDVNISATRRILEAAASSGVGKVVFTSSLYAYGSLGPAPMSERDVPTPTTVYGMSKLAGEHLLRVAARSHGLGWSVARLFFVYGPRQYAEGGYKSVVVANFERLLRNERPTIYGDGKQALDYVYVDDVVDALVMLADRAHDGLVCNVGSGRAVSVDTLTDMMLTISGQDLEPLSCPPDWTAGSVRVADTKLARDTLGWTATTTTEDGLARVWDSLKGTDG
jgi:nucleoside-diphosphate-sugar epimerase